MEAYGNNDGDSWAVITGGSDGIGLQQAKNMAAQGFNVCIIARDGKKIDEKLQEVK